MMKLMLIGKEPLPLLLSLLLLYILAWFTIPALAVWVGVCLAPYVSLSTDTCTLTFGSSAH